MENIKLWWQQLVVIRCVGQPTFICMHFSSIGSRIEVHVLRGWLRLKVPLRFKEIIHMFGWPWGRYVQSSQINGIKGRRSRGFHRDWIIWRLSTLYCQGPWQLQRCLSLPFTPMYVYNSLNETIISSSQPFSKHTNFNSAPITWDWLIDWLIHLSLWTKGVHFVEWEQIWILKAGYITRSSSIFWRDCCGYWLHRLEQMRGTLSFRMEPQKHLWIELYILLQADPWRY